MARNGRTNNGRGKNYKCSNCGKTLTISPGQGGGQTIGDAPMTGAERGRRFRARQAERRQRWGDAIVALGEIADNPKTAARLLNADQWRQLRDAIDRIPDEKKTSSKGLTRDATYGIIKMSRGANATPTFPRTTKNK